jgi:ribosome-binding ATPase YchF (GTP1/OBG family)
MTHADARIILHGKQAQNAELRAAVGKLRVEGKDYRIADGDVVNFRFNV